MLSYETAGNNYDTSPDSGERPEKFMKVSYNDSLSD